jgi:hypothetical protein
VELWGWLLSGVCQPTCCSPLSWTYYIPTSRLDHLLGEVQELRCEFTLDAVQRALAPLENIEGVLLTALFSRLLEPSLRDAVGGYIWDFQAPGELFYSCCEYQDDSVLDVWWRELCACRVLDRVQGFG